jgi:hypothetical protein
MVVAIMAAITVAGMAVATTSVVAAVLAGMAAAVGITEKFSLARAGGDFPAEPFCSVPDGSGMLVLRIANSASMDVMVGDKIIKHSTCGAIIPIRIIPCLEANPVSTPKCHQNVHKLSIAKFWIFDMLRNYLQEV